MYFKVLRQPFLKEVVLVDVKARAVVLGFLVFGWVCLLNCSVNDSSMGTDLMGTRAKGYISSTFFPGARTTVVTTHPK